MCQSMVDIQPTAAEIRRGKKEEGRKKLKDENVMVCPITLGDHKKMKIERDHRAKILCPHLLRRAATKKKDRRNHRMKI